VWWVVCVVWVVCGWLRLWVGVPLTCGDTGAWALCQRGVDRLCVWWLNGSCQPLTGWLWEWMGWCADERRSERASR